MVIFLPDFSFRAPYVPDSDQETHYITSGMNSVLYEFQEKQFTF